MNHQHYNPDDDPDDETTRPMDIDLRHVLRARATAVELMPDEAWSQLASGGGPGFIISAYGDTWQLCGHHLLAALVVGLNGLARFHAQVQHVAAQLNAADRTRYSAMVDQHAATARDSGPQGWYVPPGEASS